MFYGGDVKIARRDLVLSAANTDGGAHVDSALEPRYEYLTQGIGMAIKWQDYDDTTNVPVGEPVVSALRNPHFAGLRHLGYEVLNSPEFMALSAC